MIKKEIVLFLALCATVNITSLQQEIAQTSTSAYEVAASLLKSTPVLAGYKKEILCANFSYDGKLIATGSADNTVKLWDVKTSRLIKTFESVVNSHQGVFSVAFSPNGENLVAASRNGVIRGFRVQGIGATIFHAPADPILKTLFSSDGQRILILNQNDDYDLQMWAREEHQGRRENVLFAEFDGHTSIINSAEFSTYDARKLITASYDGTAKIWPTTTDDQPLNLQHNEPVFFGAFNSDASKAVTVTKGHVRVWDALTGASLIDVTIPNETFISAGFSHDNRHVIIAANTQGNTSKIYLLDIQDPRQLASSAQLPEIKSLYFSPVDSTILAAFKDTTARIWSTPAVIVSCYFANKTLPLQQQALLVTLDTISKQKNGAQITRADLQKFNLLWVFSQLPAAVNKALKEHYKLNNDIFTLVQAQDK